MSSSPCLRGRISSPLEAGPSVADGHHLPSHVNEALEYASRRLGRKAAHITLLVVRRDYQLPTSPIASPTFTPGPGSLPVSASSTPSRPTFPAISRIEALKQLVRPNNSGEGQIRERIVHVHLDQLRNGTVSPAFSEASAFSASTVSSASTVDSTFSQRVRWPGSPTAYGSVPVTPATPFSVMSSSSLGLNRNGALSRASVRESAQFGMKLVYTHPLSPREEKALTQALERAAKKFKLDPSWLPEAVSPSTLGLPVDLILKSTAQNEALFSSDHLTLLSLDHIYTFRTALQAYARNKAHCRLEDAVDELRRFFLANGRRALRKSALLAAYRWLDPVNDGALADVCRMYERAYGGAGRESGVENDVDPTPAWPLAESDWESEDMGRPVTKRMGMALPSRQGPEDHDAEQPEPEMDSAVSDLAAALDKEILFSNTDLDRDDESELDAIEAWYREIQIQNDVLPPVEIHPLRSHPATTTTAVVEILAPPPSPPPPPPTSSRPPTDLWPRPSESQLADLRRTTPKLSPPPKGRSLALRLQTTFDKPAAAGSKRLSDSKGSKPSHHHQQHRQHPTEKGQQGQDDDDEEEEEEELTARPHSAIKSFANVRWTAAANCNGISIDEMLHGGGPLSPLPQQQLQTQTQTQPEERVGPMTPNGYDDISPITRGEWGFLMFGKGKMGGVEMC